MAGYALSIILHILDYWKEGLYMWYDVYGSNYGKHDNLSFALIVVLFILLIIAGATFLYK